MKLVKLTLHVGYRLQLYNSDRTVVSYQSCYQICWELFINFFSNPLLYLCKGKIEFLLLLSDIQESMCG